ncbi:hypothetical protein PVL29_025019 [Vitis rotundifolia]|uniref:Uncharacterized protein n=1 Tax=Vitis rotundifolia TaxID=103349 RepID=A0AA38YTG5_VITRO|nr:hypothetical protein PVL29_025019 [Vitis rotundifolia]
MGWPPKNLGFKDGPRGGKKKACDPEDGPKSSSEAFSLPLEPTSLDPGPSPGPYPLKEGPCRLSSLGFFNPSRSTARPEEEGPTERRSTGSRVFDPTV